MRRTSDYCTFKGKHELVEEWYHTSLWYFTVTFDPYLFRGSLGFLLRQLKGLIYSYPPECSQDMFGTFLQYHTCWYISFRRPVMPEFHVWLHSFGFRVWGLGFRV